MLGVLGIPLRQELHLSDAQLEWLIAAAILSGSVLRLNFGIWADVYGGRVVMVLLLLGTAISSYLFSQATTYNQLLICAILFGLAGNSFSVGIAWNSAWFPSRLKGTALGIFGAGNVGAAGTKLLIVFVPGILIAVPAAGYLGGAIPGGWRFIPALYSALLVLMAVAIFFVCPTPTAGPAAAVLCSTRCRRFATCASGVSVCTTSLCSEHTWRCRPGCRSSTSTRTVSRSPLPRCWRLRSFCPRACCVLLAGIWPTAGDLAV